MIRSSWNKRTEEEVKEIVEDLGYFLIKQYSNERSQKRVVIQDSIGYKYDVDLHSLNNYDPYFVGKNNPFSLENISLYLKINKSNFTLTNDNFYDRANSKLVLYCSVCKDFPEMSWANIQSGFGCGVCHGKQIGKYHSLAIQRPDIAEEWNCEKNIKTPRDYKVYSGEKVFWICKACGYGINGEWAVKIDARTSNNELGCPACSGKVVSDKNRLSVLYPEIASEWHPFNNLDLKPQDVSYGTSKRVWWICPEGHEYYSSINSRTRGNGCLDCWNEEKESYLARDLKEYFKKEYDAKIEYKVFKNPKTGMWLPYDIYIPYGENPELNGFYIEVHGGQHYEISGWNRLVADKKGIEKEDEFKYKKHLDKIKKNFSQKNGFYIEIDIRKFKRNKEQAIEYIETIIKKTLS